MRPGRALPSRLTAAVACGAEYKMPLLARLGGGRSGRDWSAPSSAAERGASRDEQESLRTLARLASGPGMQGRALDGEDCRAPLPAQRGFATRGFAHFAQRSDANTKRASSAAALAQRAAQGTFAAGEGADA
jgi:hypothetical protein